MHPADALLLCKRLRFLYKHGYFVSLTAPVKACNDDKLIVFEEWNVGGAKVTPVVMIYTIEIVRDRTTPNCCEAVVVLRHNGAADLRHHAHAFWDTKNCIATSPMETHLCLWYIPWVMLSRHR